MDNDDEYFPESEFINPELHDSAQAVLDTYLEELQLTDDLLKSVKTQGAIEGALVMGRICGAVDNEMEENAVDRSEAIDALKESGIIDYKPMVFIPENAAGKRCVLKMYAKVRSDVLAELLTEGYISQQDLDDLKR